MSDSKIVTRALDTFSEKSMSGQARMINQAPLEQIVEQLDLERYAREGGLTRPALATFLERCLAVTTRLHHPAYTAHQVAAPNRTGALGSLIDDMTSNAIAIYEMGSWAAGIEFWMQDWMQQRVDWRRKRRTVFASSSHLPQAAATLGHLNLSLNPP